MHLQGVLGGKNGPLFAWIAGWFNLLGQVHCCQSCTLLPLVGWGADATARRCCLGLLALPRPLPQDAPPPPLTLTRTHTTCTQVGITAGVEYTVVLYLQQLISDFRPADDPFFFTKAQFYGVYVGRRGGGP